MNRGKTKKGIGMKEGNKINHESQSRGTDLKDVNVTELQSL
jgi:hypothetical protein